MNTRQWIALGLGLASVGAAALTLVVLGSGRLGEPGLRVGPEPTYSTNGTLVRKESVLLPSQVLDYTAKRIDITPVELNWLPKDTLFGRKHYVAKDGFGVLISVVLMGTDRTSIHKPQYCLDGQGWKIDSTETFTIPMKQPQPYDLRVMKLTTTRQGVDRYGQPQVWRGLYVYWFVADKLLTPHHGERMWWMAKDMVRAGVLQRWAYVTYFAGCLPGQEDEAFARLKELIAASVPEFQLAAGQPTQPGATASLTPSGSSRQQN